MTTITATKAEGHGDPLKLFGFLLTRGGGRTAAFPTVVRSCFVHDFLFFNVTLQRRKRTFVHKTRSDPPCVSGAIGVSPRVRSGPRQVA